VLPDAIVVAATPNLARANNNRARPSVNTC